MQKERKWCVYCHTNKINDKKYIGITSQENLNRRWGANGCGYSKQIYFYRAINKYGWDGFEHEILFKDLSEGEAKQKEIELINFYKTENKIKLYNLTNGGEGVVGLIMSDESKEKMRLSRVGRFSGENSPRFGVKHTPESILKMSEASKSKGMKYINKMAEKNSIKVVQLDKKGEYIKTWKSIKEASINLKIDSSCICNCCKYKQKFSNGYFWMYLTDYENINKIQMLELIELKNKNNDNSIPIVQLDTSGNFIKEWKSATEINIKLGFFNTNITSCCKDKIKASYGYIWMYKKDYENTKTEVIKNKISHNLINGNSIKIVQLDKFGDIIKTWDSIKRASKFYNVSSTSIHYCCKNKTNHSCGYVWMYEHEYNNIKKEDLVFICNKKLSNLNERINKKVVKLSNNNEFIESFKIAKEYKDDGFRPDRILNCCDNKIKTHKGYKWMYYDEYILTPQFLDKL